MNAHSETSLRFAHATMTERHQEARRLARTRAAREATARPARPNHSAPTASPTGALRVILSRLVAAGRAPSRTRRLPPCEGCA